ncbi:hypothetical protein CO026_00740 [Candidatus Kaiserbacteria bacterium CG_4_9_14_0_2_um_filter_41_32]|uniref:Uncharacterized protein n=1 Tax=Candidatus Kaiserbacteria bacterium CG_4_9_14_0_2_um_filter_41_32 TaxID=1974601 RepID=A0A2M8FFD4_9BACT|nr:MAG: hypothetical protein CO026_00740 [Candidatus Kaiserbacteria bacterium CG_4_9_14_0_2_um_filter_41_32]
MSKLSLEKQRVFPYLAWIAVFMFSLFVYSITLELKKTTSDLEIRSAKLEANVKQDVLDVQFPN